MEQVLSISLSIANLLALFVGGGIAYGKLVQKNNKTEEDVKIVHELIFSINKIETQ